LPSSGQSSHERAAAAWIPSLAVFFLTAFLIWSVGHPDGGVSPMLSYFFIVVLAVRHRGQASMRALFFPSTVIFLLWFLGEARQITLPLSIALLIAYLLDPLVDRFESRLGRTKAVVLLALPAMLLFGLLALFLVPALLGELDALLRKLPELQGPADRAQEWMQARAAGMGIEVSWGSLTEFLLPRLETLGQTALGAGGQLWRGLKGLLDLLSLLVITPVVTFYLLRDFDRMREGFLRTMPPDSREDVTDFFRRVDRAVSAYLRGQLLVGVIQGLLFALGLKLLGVDYALLVGLCAVFLNLVPFVGSAATAILALAVALLTEATWGSALQVGVLYAVLQTLDAAVLSPRIVGKSVELHPVAVMIAILVGGSFFSVPGVLFAVPAAAVLRESLAVWTRQLLELLPGFDRVDASTGA
jgi:predicted PurR-regulated permease PerM